MDRNGLTFVLVHGAWHGGWCYTRVAERLRARGHRVYAPTLTGVGERSHLAGPDVDLDTHVRDVVGVIRWQELTNVVLVGHSYGGMVISAVAEAVAPGTIGSIVYLDAFYPADGQCLYDYAPPTTADLLEQTRSGLVAPFTAEFFNVNPADRAWVDAQCTPHPVRCFTTRVSLTGARDRIPKKAYVLATGWTGLFQGFADALRQDPSWRVSDLAAGHDLMVDAPEELSALLERLA